LSWDHDAGQGGWAGVDGNGDDGDWGLSGLGCWSLSGHAAVGESAGAVGNGCCASWGIVSM
jgi:hypothetical protein